MDGHSQIPYMIKMSAFVDLETVKEQLMNGYRMYILIDVMILIFHVRLRGDDDLDPLDILPIAKPKSAKQKISKSQSLPRWQYVFIYLILLEFN